MQKRSSTRKATFGTAFCLSVMVFTLSGHAEGTGVDPWGVTPGKRLGQVTLGMKRQAVHALLGAPRNHERTAHGVRIERWSGGKPSAKSARLNFLADFLTVYYRDDRVVQVDASSPAFKLQNGMSTRNSAQNFQKRYHASAFRPTDRRYLHDAPDGIPATKHFVHYEDAVHQGFALQYGWWGNLAPDGDPKVPLEALSVHLPGRTVLLDPNGADRFIITYDYVQKHGYPGHPTRKTGLPQ